ncbi:MAG: hypothetical protein QXU23_07325 [Candidatus Korarchaeum sp.]
MLMRTACLLLLFLLLMPLQCAPGDRGAKRLLTYYGYPSIFNGSSSLKEASELFDKYDIVILGDDLIDPRHEEHETTRKIVRLSRAEFYGYVATMQPIERVCSQVRAWAEMGVSGVFLDEFGFDYLEPFLGSKETARLHQARAMDCVRKNGLKVALNFWFPEDVFEEVAGVSLDLRDVSVLVEHAIYGFGNKTEEYVDHFHSMLSYAKRFGVKLWCLTSTSAGSAHENRILGYDALTYLYGKCDAYAIQEDYAEDSHVFYAFSEPPKDYEYIRGANVVLWGKLNSSWYLRTLERLKGMGFDYLLITVYLRAPSPRSSHVEAFEATPSDLDLEKAVTVAKGRGFWVFLRIGLIVEGGWSGELAPTDVSGWFRSYSSYLRHYASLSEKLNVDCLVIGAELSSLDKREEWRDIVKELRTLYSGKLSYSANFNSEATSFWDLLDFIGVDAYYPIVNGSSWRGLHESRIAPLILLYGKPVIFTEIGYRSVRGAGLRPWDWWSKVERDEGEQDRLWRLFLGEEAARISGFFYWAEAPWGDDGTGYSVIGKRAESSIGEWLRPFRSFNAKGVDIEAVRRVFGNVEISEEAKIIVGGPRSNPAASIPWISFTKDSVNVNGTTYRSSWGKLDHGLIVSWRGRVYVMGTHRFGTEAALIYLKENRVSFAIVRWVDLNGNSRVEREEVFPVDGPK